TIGIPGIVGEDAVGDEILRPLNGEIVHEGMADFLNCYYAKERDLGLDKSPQGGHGGKGRTTGSETDIVFATTVVNLGLLARGQRGAGDRLPNAGALPQAGRLVSPRDFRLRGVGGPFGRMPEGVKCDQTPEVLRPGYDQIPLRVRAILLV